MGFDADTCGVMVALGHQSPDIAMGVDKGGAGDQGLMFGFACDETPELMPMPIQLAHQLMARLAELRQSGGVDWLRPDAKSQVTVQYAAGRPARVDTVVISTQHAETAGETTIRQTIIEELVKKVIPARFLDERTTYHVNPTGRPGGPDCGPGAQDHRRSCGRRHGGASAWAEVDRSAAYAAATRPRTSPRARLALQCRWPRSWTSPSIRDFARVITTSR
jgi:S-adenosylmethionine synthetase